MKAYLQAGVLCAAALLSVVAAWSQFGRRDPASPTPFVLTAQQTDAIESLAEAKDADIILIWAADCESCRYLINNIATMRARQPHLNVTLVQVVQSDTPQARHVARTIECQVDNSRWNAIQLAMEAPDDLSQLSSNTEWQMFAQATCDLGRVDEVLARNREYADALGVSAPFIVVRGRVLSGFVGLSTLSTALQEG